MVKGVAVFVRGGWGCVCRWGAWWVAILLAGCGLAVEDPSANLRRPDQVQELRLAIRSEGAMLGSAGGASGAPGEPVRLPDAWNASGREGVWVYRLHFDGSTEPENGAPTPWGVYVPRVGNRFSVWLNGQRIATQGQFGDNASDHSQRPQFFFLPSDLLRRLRNELRFEVQGERARYAGLSQVAVGPASELLPRYRWREAAQVFSSAAIFMLAGVFAVISAALAWRQGGPLARWFALACCGSALRSGATLVVDWPFDYQVAGLLRDAAYAGYLASLCQFSVAALNLRHGLIPWLNGLLLLASVGLMPLHAFWRLQGARQLWLMVMLAYGLVFAVLVIHRGWQRRDTASLAMAGAGGVSLALGVYDHVLVFYNPNGYSEYALAGYSLLAYLLVMAWLLVDHEVQRLRQQDAQRLQQDFELAQHRRELERHFEEQQRLAHVVAQQQARRRLLGDVHDGLGLQLNALLRRVETGAYAPTDLEREVRIAIDQLRLLVDNSETFEGDVAMLLAQARQHLERRLRQAGLRLDWQVRLQRPDRQLAPGCAMALQRLLFELATNTIKHAQAAHVRVEVLDPPRSPHALSLCFADDGRGFAEAAASTGSRAVNRRVQELGAQFSLHTGEAGTRCDFAFPEAIFEPEAGLAQKALLARQGNGPV